VRPSFRDSLLLPDVVSCLAGLRDRSQVARVAEPDPARCRQPGQPTYCHRARFRVKFTVVNLVNLRADLLCGAKVVIRECLCPLPSRSP